MEHINVEITGKFTKYAELRAELGYCFYDKTLSENERYYMDSVFTPVTDMETLSTIYCVVSGNADALNIELENQRMETIIKGE